MGALSGVGWVFDGDWGDTYIKDGMGYVRPVAGASHHWVSAQLPAGTRLPVWMDRINGATLDAPPVASQHPSVYQGGRKVVRFNGVNQRMDAAVNLSGAKTIFMVARFASSAKSTYGLTGGQGGAFNFFINGGGKFAFYTGTGPGVVTTKDGDDFTHAVIIVSDGANSVVNMDGTEYFGNAGTSAATALRLAATHSAYAAMDFEALGIIPGALNAADRAALMAQLRTDY